MSNSVRGKTDLKRADPCASSYKAIFVKILHQKPCVFLCKRDLDRPRASLSELSVNTTSRVPCNRPTISPNRLVPKGAVLTLLFRFNSSFSVLWFRRSGPARHILSVLMIVYWVQYYESSQSPKISASFYAETCNRNIDKKQIGLSPPPRLVFV